MSSSPAPSALTASSATSADFWRELCPELTIGGSSPRPSIVLPDADQLGLTLRTEGYINAPGVFPRAHVTALCAGVQRLADRHIPPPFIFVYDEYWRLFESLAPFLAASLGPDYRMLPDVWAWFVRPSNEAAGWKPHRDRSAVTLGPDNTPDSLTVWLPLSDTDPLNGCMYVLPAHHDPDLRNTTFREKTEYQFAGDTLQNIRALPATAGSLLAWNQSLLHWGSRASPLGTNPRCSVAAQFQRAALPPLESPLLDPSSPPPFPDRLGLIGHLIYVFSGFLSFPPETRLLATILDWKHWRRAGAR